MNLQPTLWRTCRILSNPTRVKLLEGVLSATPRPVSKMAEAFGISESRASQELRRLQSRGLITRTYAKNCVVYVPRPDPSIPWASGILSAVQKSLKTTSRDKFVRIAVIAHAFAHDRRIQLFRILSKSPASISGVLMLSGMTSTHSAYLHLQALMDAHFVVRTGTRYSVIVRHYDPLARMLAKLVLHGTTTANNEFCFHCGEGR